MLAVYKMQTSPRILLYDYKDYPLRDDLSSLPSTVSSGAGRNKPHTGSGDGIRTNFTTSTERVSFDGTPGGAFYESESPILGDVGGNPGQGHRRSMVRDFGPPPPKSNSMAILLGSVLGIGIGIALYHIRISDEVQKIVALPGDLFLRAFLCLILPMVFCVMTVVVAETVAMGRTSILRWRTLVPYWLTSFLSTSLGMALALLFKSYFTSSGAFLASSSSSLPSFNLTLQCGNGMFLAAQPNGTVACVSSAANGTQFVVFNQSRLGSNTAGVVDLSIMDQVIAIVNLMVPVNIVASFTDGSLLSIVLFSIPLGFATAYSVPKGEDNDVLQLVRQLRNVFLYMLNKLLLLTPFAVVFLMSSAIAKMNPDTMSQVMSEIGYLFAAFLIGVGVHVGVVLPIVLYLWTKCNPYMYLKHLVPAYVFAFGCSSSMATLPVAIACIQDAKVSRALAHIAMPFGTPVNLNACGIYYPLALVFMATMGGLESHLTVPRYCILFFASLLGCIGTAPVPNSSLVYNLTLWKTCFPSDPLPSSFAFLVAAEFLLDRIRTMVNVNGNAVVTRILADQVDETFEVQASCHV